MRELYVCLQQVWAEKSELQLSAQEHAPSLPTARPRDPMPLRRSDRASPPPKTHRRTDPRRNSSADPPADLAALADSSGREAWFGARTYRVAAAARRSGGRRDHRAAAGAGAGGSKAWSAAASGSPPLECAPLQSSPVAAGAGVASLWWSAWAGGVGWGEDTGKRKWSSQNSLLMPRLGVG